MTTHVLVEEQVPGENQRLLFLHGALVEAVKQAQPLLVGDGIITIDQLISAPTTPAAGHRSSAAEPP